eukprot:9588554-Karenia_brevis.AAC.1
MEIQNPVDVTNLRNLSMSTVSWPCHKYFGDAMMNWRYIPCESASIMDVRLVRLPRISGLLKITEAFCM